MAHVYGTWLLEYACLKEMSPKCLGITFDSRVDRLLTEKKVMFASESAFERFAFLAKLLLG